MSVEYDSVGREINAFFADVDYIKFPGILSHGEVITRADIVLPYTLSFQAKQ